jgi:hypothetical protein
MRNIGNIFFAYQSELFVDDALVNATLLLALLRCTRETTGSDRETEPCDCWRSSSGS